MLRSYNYIKTDEAITEKFMVIKVIENRKEGGRRQKMKIKQGKRPSEKEDQLVWRQMYKELNCMILGLRN